MLYQFIWTAHINIINGECFCCCNSVAKATVSDSVGCSLEKAMAPHSSALAWRTPRTGCLVGCSPWGREELDTTERLHFHFSLSCLGEGHGNPLQCSCLENPRDGGAWRVAVYGVAQSRTRLKRRRRSSRTAVCQVPLSIICQSLLKFKSIESPHSLLPSSHFAFNLSQHQGIFK